MTGRILVLTTVATTGDATRIARALVDGRLAACVSVLPRLTSFYRWKGKTARDDERLLLIKTRGDRFEDVRGAILSAHPYAVPEIVALPMMAGHAPYFAWLDEAVRRGPRPSAPPAARKRRERGAGRRSGPPRPRSRR